MSKNGKNKLSKGIPKAEFPPLDTYLESPDERGWGYVRIPVEEVIDKPPRLCSIIGPQKTWETDIQTLTEQLNIKHKDPIDFKDKGKCWAFYFDEDAGTLYNGPKDEKPILELRPAPKQEYVYAKTEESSKPASTENSQMSNSSVSSENKQQEKPIHNSTSVIKKEKRKESILSKKKGNERAPKELPTVNKKPFFTSDSNTSSIKDQSDDKAAPPQKIEKALDEQQKLSPGELFLAGKEYEKKGEYDKAIQAYRAAVDAGFNHAGYKLGQLLMKLAIDIFHQIAGLGHAGAQRELEKLEEKNPPQKKADKSESSVATKPLFRYQRNRIAELNGCGDMAETETSVLHAEQAEETTWIGEEKKDNPPPPEGIIQEIVRYVTYWWGDDCLPELIRVDCPEPEVWECTSKSGQEFSAESIVWTEDFTEVLPREEESPQNEAEDASDKLPREDVGEPSWGDIFALIFRKLFSFFAND